MSANSQKRRETAQKRFFFSLPLCCISSRGGDKRKEKNEIYGKGKHVMLRKKRKRGLPPSLPPGVCSILSGEERGGGGGVGEREKVNKKIWERGGGKERKEKGRETDNATLSINPTTSALYKVRIFNFQSRAHVKIKFLILF